jgi:hypothetical protein
MTMTRHPSPFVTHVTHVTRATLHVAKAVGAGSRPAKAGA